MKDNDWQATVIKILAVVTATPRWVGALLAAEGLVIPADWSWWVIASAIMSAAMAAVEGWAFSYVFEAWRNQEDAKSELLGRLIFVSAALFVVVLAPYIAASVTHKALADILAWPVALYVWSIAVGGSTIAIVASVGYAQKHKAARKVIQANAATNAPSAQPTEPPQAVAQAAAYPCPHCARGFASQQALAAHLRKHKEESARIAVIERAEPIGLNGKHKEG